MGKLVVALGSPREGSISTMLANEAVRGAKEAGYEVVTYNLWQMNIKGCQGCGACRANGIDCVIEDDMRAYWKDLHECDALLITAPNYHSTVAGHVITFMNRHYCLNNADRSCRLKPGIKVGGIFTQGAPEGMNPKYQENYEWFMSNYTAKGMESVGLIVSGATSDLEAKKKQAYEMFKKN
jgi:multimeric flavodoxin WrbA